MSNFNLQKMFSLKITETIIPLALIASESIAHYAFGLMGYWLIAHSGSRNNCLVFFLLSKQASTTPKKITS